METVIPEELSALMALEQGMSQGTVAPTTPQGTPTVAAQMANVARQQMAPPQMQAPGQPGLMEMLQQAGLGGQIQAMQQQQQQQQAQDPQAIAQMAAQMMQARMQQAQQQRPQGIESLNPNIPGYRDGGIVGYQAGGSTRVTPEEQRARDRDAMAILQAELIKAQQEASTGDPRAMGDVEALNREIARLSKMLGVTPIVPMPMSNRGTPVATPKIENRAVTEVPSGPPVSAPSGEVVSAGDYYAEPLSAQERSTIDPFAGLRKIDPRRLFQNFADFAGRNVMTDPETGETVARLQPPKMQEIPIPEIKIQEQTAAAPSQTPAAANVAATTALALPPRVGIGTLPVGEMGPPIPSAGERQILQGIARQQANAPQMVTPEKAMERYKEEKTVREAQMRAEGIEPDLYAKIAAEAEKRGTERGQYYDALAAQARERAERNRISNFLMNARGRTLGETLRAGAMSAEAMSAAAEAQAQRVIELKFAAQDAANRERNLARQVQYEIANGRMDKARDSLQKYEDAKREHETKMAQLQVELGKHYGTEERHRLEREVQQRGQDIQYMAGVQRAQPKDPYNTIIDNVENKMRSWLGTVQGSIAKPEQIDAQRKIYLQEEIRIARAIGTPLPADIEERLIGAKPNSTQSQQGAPRAKFLGYEK